MHVSATNLHNKDYSLPLFGTHLLLPDRPTRHCLARLPWLSLLALLGFWNAPIRLPAQDPKLPEGLDAATAKLIRDSAGQISRISLNSQPLTLTRWHTDSPRILSGQVLILDVKELVLRDPTEGRIQRYPSQHVVGIDVAWGSDDALKAHEAFLQGNFRDSTRLAQAALKPPLLRWQQTLLVAEIIDALWARQAYRSAATTYLKLLEERPPLLLHSTIPLAWLPIELDQLSLDAALQWQQSDQEHAQLIAASWLLTSSSRKEARDTLNQLLNSKIEWIRQLAQAQLWRLEPAQDAMSTTLRDWSSHRDAIFLPFQLGPNLLLAEKLDQAGSRPLAVAEWTRIAVLHADRYHALAPNLLKQIASATDKTALADEGQRLIQSLKREP